MIPLPTGSTPAACRRQLQQYVQQLAIAWDSASEIGQPDHTAQDLDALAIACDANHLPAEAARIRRWLGRPTRERGHA
jgi:hypothetical protein